MANAIIQSYLADTSIPLEKRKNVIKALKSGQSEKDLADILQAKYSEYLKMGGNTNVGARFRKTIENEEAFANVDITQVPQGIDPNVWNVLDERGKRSIAVNTARLQSLNPTKAQEIANEMKSIGNDIAQTKYQASPLGIAEQGIKNIAGAPYALAGGALKGVTDTLGNVADLGQAAADTLSGGLYKYVREGVMGENFKGGDIWRAIGDTLDTTGKKIASENIGVGEEVAETMSDIGYTGEKFAEFIIPSSKIMHLGKAAQAAIKGSGGALRTIAGVLGRGAVEAGLYGGISTVQEGKLNKNVLTTAAIAGTLPVLGTILKGGWSTLASKVTGRGGTTPKEILENQLLRNGMKEQYANLLGNVDDSTRSVAKDYLDVGLQKLENHAADDVYTYAANESGLNHFMEKIDGVKETLGQKLGAAKDNLRNVTVNKAILSEGKREIDNILKQYNVKIVRGVIKSYGDLSGSGLTSQIDNIYAVFRKKSINARDLESFTSQIDRLSGQLSSTGVKTSDPAIRALTNIKNVVNKTLEQADDVFGKANKEYAKFIKLYKQIKKAGNVNIGDGQKVFNTTQILKRSLTTNDAKYNNAINAMTKLAKKYKLTTPQDLRVRALLADMAETITGTPPPRSLSGMKGAEELASRVSTKIKGAIKTKQMLGEIITGKGARPIQEQVTKVINILDDSLKSGTQAVIPLREASDLRQILGAVYAAIGAEARTGTLTYNKKRKTHL